MEALVQPVAAKLQDQHDKNNSSLTISFSASPPTNYSSFFSAISGVTSAGAIALSSSRLLGRKELVETPRGNLVSYLKIALANRNAIAGSFATIGLSGGPGVINAPEERWVPCYQHGAPLTCTSSSPGAASTWSGLGRQRLRFKRLRRGARR